MFVLPKIPIVFHFFTESLAYFIAARLFFFLRKEEDNINFSQRSSTLIGCVLGAFIGAKLLSFLENPSLFITEIQNNNILGAISSGKTIAGALLGGLIGVEITKKIIGLKKRTGDLYVLPLLIGIVIGRIGCFLTGLEDKTYGIKSNLPWAVNFGDAVFRHPIQVYEIIFCLFMILGVLALNKIKLEEGMLFKFFMIGYFSFRFFVSFLKPSPKIYLGLDIIQVSSIALIIYYLFWFIFHAKHKE